MTALRETVSRIGARILPGMENFLQWWKAALMSWLPARWRALLGLSDARLLLSPQSDCIEVLHVQDGLSRPLLTLREHASPTALEAGLSAREANLPRFALLPANAALRRPLRLPTAAGRRLHDVLRFEIDRQTPFNTDQVHFDARPLRHHDDGHMEAELVVAPRRTIEALLSPRDAWQGQIDGVDVATSDGATLGVNLLPPAQRRQRNPSLRRANHILLLAALAMLALSARQFLENRREAAERLTRQVEAEALRARAVSIQRQQLQDLLDGQQFFAQQRAQRPTVTAVIDELSRRLEDDTWLERLSIEGKRMQLTGMSGRASSLAARLEGASLWKTPALTGVLQGSGNGAHERFTLAAELRNLQQEPANDAAAPSP